MRLLLSPAAGLLIAVFAADLQAQVKKDPPKVGVDIDPERIKESKQAARAAKVEDRVEFRQGDVLKITEMSDATVVCLYLFPEVNERLKPMLKRTLKPGSRVVSHDFLMGDDWKPEKEVTVRDADGQQHTLYLWTIKDKK